MVRDERGADARRGEGVETAFGDLSDPKSLREATEGCDAVFLVLPLVYDRERVLAWMANAIDAAREAGMERLVFSTSGRVPPEPTDVAAFEVKREAEAYLEESAVPHVVLRPPLYMENFEAPWVASGIADVGVVAYPIPRQVKVSWLSVNDMAALCAEALFWPELSSIALHVGGPEALDGEGVAAAFSRVLGRGVRYQPIPPDEFEAALRTGGEAAAADIAAGYRWMAENEDSRLFVSDPEEIRERFQTELMDLEKGANQREWTGPAMK
ncbi:MAG: NmrA family NAD(P)-binding protein [Rubrobacter sp.]